MILIECSIVNSPVTPDWRPYCDPTPLGRGENAERRRGDPKDAEGRRATAITLVMFKVNAEVWRPGSGRRGIALGSPWSPWQHGRNSKDALGTQYRRVRVAVETRRNGSGTPRRPYCVLTTSMGFLRRPHHVYGVLTAMSGRICRESSSCPSLRRSWHFYGVPTTTMAFLPNLHCVPSATMVFVGDHL